jgi:hypothetical protein
MNVKTDFKCRCGIRRAVLLFRRPGFLETTLVNHKCPDCESEFFLKFKRAKNRKNPNELGCEVRITKMSKLLEDLIKEEEEYKNKAVEE